jgi:hypothetical protein
MPTPTYFPLANITLGSAASTVTFSSIPATYRDLVLAITALHNTTSDVQASIRPNNDSGNASLVYMDGRSSGGGFSNTDTKVGLYYQSGAAANSPMSVNVQIFDYSATDKHKGFLIRSGHPAFQVSLYGARWASTSAITSLVIPSLAGGDFQAGSTFALYGIAS